MGGTNLSFKSAVPMVSPTGETLSSGSSGMSGAAPVVYDPQTYSSYQSSPSQPAPTPAPATTQPNYMPQVYSPFRPTYASSMYSPFSSYNPYYSFAGSGYNQMFAPNYYNNMAYSMAGLPSYNIPYAGNYYNYMAPMSPYSGMGFNTALGSMNSGYTPGTLSYSQNLPYYMPGVGMGTYDDWF